MSATPKVGDLNGPDFDGPICDAVSPEQYGCTMRPGHVGPHVAEGDTNVLAVWGQPEPAPVELPEAAVDAAARALVDVMYGDENPVAPHDRKAAVDVLTAALPHLALTVNRDTIAHALAEHRGVDTLFLDRQRCACGARPANDERFRNWHEGHRADAVLAVLAEQPTVAEVKAQALREAANEYGPGQLTFFGTPQQYTAAWLHARANAIEAGERP